MLVQGADKLSEAYALSGRHGLQGVPELWLQGQGSLVACDSDGLLLKAAQAVVPDRAGGAFGFRTKVFRVHPICDRASMEVR